MMDNDGSLQIRLGGNLVSFLSRLVVDSLALAARLGAFIVLWFGRHFHDLSFGQLLRSCLFVLLDNDDGRELDWSVL